MYKLSQYNMIREIDTIVDESELRDPQFLARLPARVRGCAMTWQAATGCLASQPQEIRYTDSFVCPGGPASGCCWINLSIILLK